MLFDVVRYKGSPNRIASSCIKLINDNVPLFLPGGKDICIAGYLWFGDTVSVGGEIVSSERVSYPSIKHTTIPIVYRGPIPLSIITHILSLGGFVACFLRLRRVLTR